MSTASVQIFILEQRLKTSINMLGHTILNKTVLTIPKRAYAAMVKVPEFSFTKERETSLIFLAHFYFHLLQFWK
jgi:hypothetical protein